MSVWTHPICDRCWHDIAGDRVPSRLVEPLRELERCCWCGDPTRSGIYRREDPKLLPEHHVHADGSE